MSNVIALPAGEAPGLVWRTRSNGERVAYWVAPKKAVATGFKPTTHRLAGGQAEMGAACRRLQAEANDWIAGNRDSGVTPSFDGSITSLIRLYQVEPLSGFAKLKYNTRNVYVRQLALLERTVGTRQLHALSARDFDRWYTEFRKPAYADGPERISRAHYLMTMIRMLVGFGVIMEIEECARLQMVLHKMRFENAAPRTSVLTYDMVKAFCSEARKSGRLSLALATAIQFECALRQRDVIGEWMQLPEAEKAHGPSGKQWTTGLIWGGPRNEDAPERLPREVSPDLVMIKATSKSKGRQVVEVDWKRCPLIMEQLQYVPPERRIGPVIVSETTGRPYFIDAFCMNWRAVARRAGIPDNIWNMDARSGAITEASDAGAKEDHLRTFATHKSLRMTGRYNRGNRERNDRIADMRIAHRAQGRE